MHAFVGPGSTRPNATGVGGHGFSPDGLTWTYSPTPAYTTAVAWKNGSATSLYRRERPQPLVQHGRVLVLYNGAWPCKSYKEDFGRECLTYTMASTVL